MFDRRHFISAGALALAFAAGAAHADDWKSKYKELTFAVIPAENASGVSDRYAPFMEYLTKELGVPVKLRIANDYAAVIEGQRAGNIQIAFYGPASYSTDSSGSATLYSIQAPGHARGRPNLRSGL